MEANRSGDQVLIAGKPIIRSTPPSSTPRMGAIDRHPSGIDWLKRQEDSRRFIPTSGIRKPRSKFARKMIPRWCG